MKNPFVIKDEKKIEKIKDKYRFKHVLIQELEQSNVNAIVENAKETKISASYFIQNFDKELSRAADILEERFAEKKKEKQEFLDMINNGDKTKIALEMLDKIIKDAQNFIDNYDAKLKEAHKEIEKPMLNIKMKSKQELENSKKTLEMWSKYYKKKKKEEKHVNVK